MIDLNRTKYIIILVYKLFLLDSLLDYLKIKCWNSLIWTPQSKTQLDRNFYQLCLLFGWTLTRNKTQYLHMAVRHVLYQGYFFKLVFRQTMTNVFQFLKYSRHFYKHKEWWIYWCFEELYIWVSTPVYL